MLETQFALFLLALLVKLSVLQMSFSNRSGTSFLKTMWKRVTILWHLWRWCWLLATLFLVVNDNRYLRFIQSTFSYCQGLQEQLIIPPPPLFLGVVLSMLFPQKLHWSENMPVKDFIVALILIQWNTDEEWRNLNCARSWMNVLYKASTVLKFCNIFLLP